MFLMALTAVGAYFFFVSGVLRDRLAKTYNEHKKG